MKGNNIKEKLTISHRSSRRNKVKKKTMARLAQLNFFLATFTFRFLIIDNVRADNFECWFFN